MKRIALVAAILAVAACSRGETPATDTTTPGMAPAPASDTTARMDSAGMTTKTDTTAATKTP